MVTHTPRASARARARLAAPVTHAAAGPAVVPPPGERVERLRAFHAHAHLVVSDPAGGAAAEFLRLENTRAVVHPNVCYGSSYSTSLDASLKLSVFFRNTSIDPWISCRQESNEEKTTPQAETLTCNKPKRPPPHLNPLVPVLLRAGEKEAI